MKKLILLISLALCASVYAESYDLENLDYYRKWAVDDAKWYYDHHKNPKPDNPFDSLAIGKSFAIKYRHLEQIQNIDEYSTEFCLTLNALYSYP